VFLVDHDDPAREEYAALALGWPLEVVAPGLRRIGPILNHYAPKEALFSTHTGFMGDDHLPRTPGWDEKLIAALDGKPGVAYGNDLIKGAELPTAVVMSSDIILALGYLVPAALEHLYLDDFWKKLGEGVGNLAYQDDVIIEHMHPTVGQAAWDETYASANNGAQYALDGRRYAQYVADEWPGELARLRKALGL
jgi:hypothetical protein